MSAIGKAWWCAVCCADVEGAVCGGCGRRSYEWAQCVCCGHASWRHDGERCSYPTACACTRGRRGGVGVLAPTSPAAPPRPRPPALLSPHERGLAALRAIREGLGAVLVAAVLLGAQGCRLPCRDPEGAERVYTACMMRETPPAPFLTAQGRPVVLLGRYYGRKLPGTSARADGLRKRFRS